MKPWQVPDELLEQIEDDEPTPFRTVLRPSEDELLLDDGVPQDHSYDPEAGW